MSDNSYSSCNIPEIKNAYVSLLNDNLSSLIDYIYSNTTVPPYNNPEIRIALSLQMLFSSEKLINPNLSTKIAKDINDLLQNSEFLSKWEHKDKKIKMLKHELNKLIKSTELDDTISLNISEEDLLRRNELYSSVSTMMPVSQNVPMKFDKEDQNTCSIS
jgi:hypothetical protein